MAIALVKQFSGTFPYAASLTVTPPSSVGSGNLLVLTIRGQEAIVTSVTGGGVTTWTNVVSAVSSTPSGASIWCGISSGSSAGIVITTSGHPTGTVCGISEWSGASATTNGTSHNNGNNASTGYAPGSITPTASTNVLLVTSWNLAGGAITGTNPPTGFTKFTDASTAQGEEYQLVSSASGSYAPTYTGTAYVKWAATMACFTASSGAVSTHFLGLLGCGS